MLPFLRGASYTLGVIHCSVGGSFNPAGPAGPRGHRWNNGHAVHMGTYPPHRRLALNVLHCTHKLRCVSAWLEQYALPYKSHGLIKWTDLQCGTECGVVFTRIGKKKKV